MLRNKRKGISKLGRSIANALNQAIAFKKGEDIKVVSHKYPILPKNIDVKSIRKKLDMTQEEFTQFGFTISAIRHWENNRRVPEGPARILLKIIESNPKIVTKVLNESSYA